MTYIERPRRLLNVLCMLYLRPVSKRIIPESLSLLYLSLGNSILKNIDMKSRQKAEDAKLICVGFVVWG